jgi:hypothetical protein
MDNTMRIVGGAYKLKVAASPHKARLLALIEELRQGIESETIVGLFALPVKIESGFDTIFVGGVTSINLAGMLGQAWLEAQNLVKSGGDK